MPRVIFQVSDDEKQLWVEAAHRELVSLSEWLRRAAEARLAEADAGPSQERAVSPGEGHPSKSSGSRASVSASAGETVFGVADCPKQKMHHIYHSGKPCPVCGYPKGDT